MARKNMCVACVLLSVSSGMYLCIIVMTECVVYVFRGEVGDGSIVSGDLERHLLDGTRIPSS